MRRMLVAMLLVMIVVLIPGRSAAGQNVTSTGHPDDGWSHSCSSSSECDAWYQWHMKCVHGQRRPARDCDNNFPGAAPMAVNPATVTLALMGLGAGGGALLALMQDASLDPNAPLDQQKSTPYVTYIAGGAAVGTAAAGFGFLMAKAPKKAAIFTLAGLGGAGLGALSATNANNLKPAEEREANKESGKLKKDQLVGAAVGATAAAGLTAAGMYAVKVTKAQEFSVIRRLGSRYPVLRRAKVAAGVNPFGSSWVEVIVR